MAIQGKLVLYKSTLKCVLKKRGFQISDIGDALFDWKVLKEASERQKQLLKDKMTSKEANKKQLEKDS